MVEPKDSSPGEETPPDSAPGSPNFNGEDFLFHLYRGSELLQDNCVAEAKEELERALGMQPRDAEGQALLGVVYFRLGLYPRAIGIYEDLLRAFPQEVTPRMNLALCYLKTGQHQQAREMLEDVVRRVPNHQRAWGYLGLVFERFHDYGKAQAAFERAGQNAMAKRMEQRLSADRSLAETNPDRERLREAAAEAVREIELDPTPFSHAEAESQPGEESVGQWRPHEPGREEPREAVSSAVPDHSNLEMLPSTTSLVAAQGPMVSIPALSAPRLYTEPGTTPGELAAQVALPTPESGVALPGNRLAIVRVTQGLTVRSSAVRALLPDERPFEAFPAHRRARGKLLDEPLGGVETALGTLQGAGLVVLGVTRSEASLAAFTVVPGELFYVREDFLVGFEDTLRHESGRLSRGDAGQYPMVQLSGEGAVIIQLEGLLQSIVVTSAATAVVKDSRVVGWTGRLLPRPVDGAGAPAGGRGFIGFSGSGSIFAQLD